MELHIFTQTTCFIIKYKYINIIYILVPTYTYKHLSSFK